MGSTENTLSPNLKINWILDLILVLFIPILTTIGVFVFILSETEAIGYVIMGISCLTLLGVTLVWFKLLFQQIANRKSSNATAK